jgi:hypothetical protein
MIKKFRIWMADMFLSLAMMADFDAVLLFIIESMEKIDAQIAKNETATNETTPPKKRGRPKGRKDSVGGKASA